MMDDENNDSGNRKTGLKLLSVVIPARDEEGCIASTVEHLHLELKLPGFTDT
jgi:dolichol-phosphate mannosyltransferase